MIPPFYDPQQAPAPAPAKTGQSPARSDDLRPTRIALALARAEIARLNGRMTSSVPSVRLFVEGRSDVAAVVTLARARGVDLRDAAIVSLEGITNVRRELTGRRDRLPTAVLCDAGETGFVTRALERDDHDEPIVRIFICDRDLEEELIRALGPDRAEEVVREAGLGDSFDRMSRQPPWRSEPRAAQLRRFAGAGAGRKELLAAAWATALTPERTPPALAAAVAWLGDAGAR